MSDHPDLEALDRHLREPDAAVDAHIASCAACAATLRALGEQAALTGELRAAVDRRPARRTAPEPPRIAGYEDFRLLSTGGQGVVWRARQSATRRDVALKLLVGAAYAGPRTRARFEREVELAASLRHPHLVTVFDSGEAADGTQWFAMEFIEGRPFTRWAREGGQRREREVLGCFAMLCRAVDAAHRRGVIHRDLKSSNVLVDAAGEPHVLDFGLATQRFDADDELDGRLTRTGEFMGTLAYASPEHVSGDPRKIDVRSDVYSLGVLAYEALTGRLPHDVSGSAIAAAARIQSTPFDRAPLAALPKDAATILARALAVDPERRYASAGALADDVARFLAGEAIDARRDSTLYVLRKAVARHRWRFSALAAAFVLLVVFAVVATTLWRRAEASRELAASEADRANELSGFWRGLFDAIDPERAEGRRLDVREVLDDAAERMATHPARSPRAEMELAASIARTYHKLGNDERAWPLMARAAALAQRELGVAHPWTAAAAIDAARLALRAASLESAQTAVGALAGLAVAPYTRDYLEAELAMRRGDGEVAQAKLERALETLDGVDTSLDLEGAVAVLLEMSELAKARGDFSRGESLARRAIPLAERIGGAEGNRGIQARFQLALVLDAKGRREEALGELERAASAFRRRYGDEHPTTVNAEAVAALVRGRERGLEGARAELAQLAAKRTALVAAGDAQSVIALQSIAELAQTVGDLALASELLAAALVTHERLVGFPPAQSAELFGFAADVASECGDFAGASAHVEAARAATRAVGEVLPRRELRLAKVRAVLAARDPRGGEALDEALEAAREAALHAASFVGDDGHAKAVAARTLALVLAMRGELDAAEATLREARVALTGTSRAGGALDAALASDLGDVLLQRMRAADAEPVLREALQLRRAALGPTHPDTAVTANLLGTALFFQRKGPPELPALWEEARVALEAASTDRPALASVLNNLGAWAQVVDKDEARAEALLRRGLDVGERVLGPTHPLLAPSLANVATHDLRHGEVDAARAKLTRALGILAPLRGESHEHVRQLREMLRELGDGG